MTRSVENCLTEATRALRRAHRLVAAEIANYPTPISGGDPQFNHLLSERSRIADALGALASRPLMPVPQMSAQGAGMEGR